MNNLAQPITPRFLFRFTLPNVIMMVFNALYVIVDGVFVSNFVGTNALSAVNIAYPMQSAVLAMAIMLATGGSAVAAKQMGQGNAEKARNTFSLLIATGLIIGLLIGAITLLCTSSLVVFLGANDAIYGYCYDYLHMLGYFFPLSMLQIMFQFLFVTAGRPTLGLVSIAMGGLSNIVLDYVFIVQLNMGIMGAGLATGVGFTLPALFGLVYFAVSRQGALWFVRPSWDGASIIKACTNGASEMVSNLAICVSTLLFNLLMMHHVGEDGVAAITIVLYAQFLFNAVYFGYCGGMAPLVSYNYGAGDTGHLKQLYTMSLRFVLTSSLVTTVVAFASAGTVATLFASASQEVYDLTVTGLHLFAVGFLFMGYNLFASNFFTALSNGKVSATLSFIRTIVLIVGALIVMPHLWGVMGIWLALPTAEALSTMISWVHFKKYQSQYGY
ncbi:MATE family efflux transporter [Bengtsoniella intestinalis]|uniref:MATE family efflux transporter n=1 Tax=Bengtsoniella intestinalis TaxID=3073143 RepID=UPI00391F9790